MALISVQLDIEDKVLLQKLNNIKKSIGQLDDRPGDFVPSFDVSNLPGALRQISTLQGALGSLANLGPVGAAIGVGLQLGQMAFELGEAGATALRTRTSFDSMAASVNQSGQVMLQAMRTASRGTIADAELMAAANKAIGLGVADSAEEMGQLVQAAILKGREAGVGATQAVNDLITGIGRMSPEILDNLNIAGAKGAFAEYAAELGKTADQLTDVEKKQALVNSVLASTAGRSVADDAASAFERMQAATQNLKENLGILFAPAMAAVAESLAATAAAAADMANPDGINAMGSLLADLDAHAQRYEERLRNIQALAQGDWNPAELPIEYQAAGITGAADAQAQNARLEAQKQAFETLKFAIEQTNEALSAGVPAAESWGATLRFVADESLRNGQVSQQNLAVLSALIPIIAQGTAAYQAQAAAVQTTTASVANLDAALKNAQPLLASMASIRQGAISQAQTLALQAAQAGANPDQVAALLGQVSDELWNLGLSYDNTTEAQFRNRLAVDGQLDPLRQLAQQYTAVGQAASGQAASGLTTFNQSLSSLQSNVQSLITQSMSLDGITWPGMESAGGPRPDAINENARRLAAIANEGLTGQDWLGEFAAEAPGAYADLMLKIAAGMNPQAAAQQLMGEFQAGLRPELLDREMIKERVRQMLLGESNAAALAQELAAELAAEMGVSLPQALGAAQSALGVGAAALGAGGEGTATDPTGEGTTAGVAFQSGFLSGFAPTDAAVAILTGIAAGFTANATAIAASGKAVGAAWGSNFLAAAEGAIPPQLIAVLTSLVTPAVWAQIQTNQGLTTPPP